MHRWAGRVAVVTGASSGIGAGICRELVKQGMVVVGCARKAEKIEAISKEPEISKYSGKLHAIKCDMAVESDILAMYEEIQCRFGRLHVCVNNAISSVDSSLISGDPKDWRYMLEVGILGLCVSTKEAVKLMQDTDLEQGQIIQMGSITGYKIPPYRNHPQGRPFPWFNIYHGMKFMRRALAEGLRQELEAVNADIRVSTVSPGSVETEHLARATNTDLAAAFYSSYKCLQPKDVADAVTYILSTPPHVHVHDVIVEPMAFMM